MNQIISRRSFFTRTILMVLGIVSGAAYIQAQAKPTTIVAFGDSITAPRKGVVVYSKMLENEFAKSSSDVRIVNSGVSGNTTAMAQKRFEKDVLSHNPDIVIIQFGTNDAAVDVWKDPPSTTSRVSKAEFEQNLRAFVTALKAIGARSILVAPPPTRWTDKLKEMYGKPPYDPSDVDGFNVILRDYIKIVRHVGKDMGVPVIDLFSAYYKYEKKTGRKMDGLFLDGVHPNTAGQQIETDLLLKQLHKMRVGK